MTVTVCEKEERVLARSLASFSVGAVRAAGDQRVRRERERVVLSSILQRDRILSAWELGMQKGASDGLKRVSCYPFFFLASSPWNVQR